MTSHSHWLVLFYVRVLLLLDSQLSAVQGQDAPTVTLGPAQVTGMLKIVEGSNIQLFCSATSTSGVAPDISWVRNVTTLENTLPNTYFRTSSDGTTDTSSVLTFEHFESADDDTYFCFASIPSNDGGTVAQSSGTAVLTAVSFSSDDATAIELTREPGARECTYDNFADNRVSVALGTQFDLPSTDPSDQLMVASAELATFRNLETQSIVWVRDGVVIAENGLVVPSMMDPITADSRYTIDATATIIAGDHPGLWQTVLTISNFQASDAGVYQVIFTDNVTGGPQLLTTFPIRLDTDEPAVLVTVSPAVIDLVLGEPLLIEVSASGGYSAITWMRNGAALSDSFSDIYVSHDEVYYTATTDMNALGEYSITATGGGPTVTVAVLPYITPTTDILNTAIEVMEGGSVSIACISSGILTPTIEWELVSGSLPFTPTVAALVDPVITQVSPLMFDVGSLTLVLPITNAVFPDHQGTYRCTGTNSHAGVATIDDDTVQVTVLARPVVVFPVSLIRIQLGGTVTLTCTVIRSNPSNNYTYTWTLLPATAVSGPTASTQSTDMLAVTFDMEDDYGTYRCSVENDAGLVGTADIVIEEGFLPDVSISGGPATPTTDDTVDLTCLPGNGDSPITYQWVDVADDGVTLSTDAIYTATVSGSVTYRCTATNELGMDSAEVTVVEAAVQSAPIVTLGPAQVTGTLEIVSGSNIQLFCSATSTSGVAPDILWTRNAMILENSPPSIYFRTSSDGTNTTSSVLTIKDFQSADDGTYFCSGSIPSNDGGTIGGSSGTAVLTAVSFGPSDSEAIELTRDPVSREDTYDAFADNRVSVALGSQFDPAGTPNPDQLMVAAANLASFRVLETQSIVWVRDGELIAENGVTPTNGRYTLTATETTLGGSGQWRTVLVISGFQASDVGVYQVIFTDSVIGGSEVLTTTPVRLDTDGAATLARVSPAIIDQVLGEPLLIEVSASGGYSQISWMRNGAALSGTFVSHDEVYYTAMTTSVDIGEYSITATGGGPTVTVAVLDYTPPMTSILNATIEVMEGGSADIMCTSTGILTPTIEWELVSGSLPFTPVDSAPVNPTVTPPVVNEGILTSVLPITNAVFPDHQGTYRCAGTNSHAGVTSTDDDTVLVTVLVTPEVQVSATRTRIQLGGTVNLTCTVIRSNPSSNYMYTWTLLPATAVSGPTASTQSTDMLEVTFDMEDDYGTYRCSVQNNAGLVGTADIVIEQGFLPDVSISGGPVIPTTDDTVDLTCLPGNGDSPITYQWVDVADDGVTLSTNAMYTATVSGSVTYRCTATNDLGMDSAEVTVVEALPPVIVPSGPASMSVMVGQTLTLFVIITGFNLPITVNWNFELGAVMDGVDRISLTTSADLTTPPVIATLVRMPILSLEDAGNYDVSASNAAGNVLSGFTVTVLAPPSITFPAAPTMVTVSGGETATLTCSAFGSPAPEFEWFMNGSMTALVDGGLVGRVTISSAETMSDFFYVISTLTISNAQVSDATNYTCRATNSVDSVGVDETYTLTVNVQAVITVDPVNMDAEYLSNVSLSCTAQGVPVPDFAWTVDSGSGPVDVVESGRISITTVQISITEQMSTLTLTSVRPSDTATYTCNANNSIGTDSRSAELTVQAQPEVLSTVPADPMTANVNVGNDIVLTCTARGAPETTFAWFRREPDVQLMTGSRVLITAGVQSGTAPDFVTVESTLMIFSSEESDAGIYSCVASNMVFSDDRSDSENFTLMINFPPLIVQAVITVDPVNTDAEYLSNVSLSCTAQGVPVPDFAWTVDSGSGPVDVVESGRISITTVQISINEQMSTLTLTSVRPSDTATYTCNANNSNGTDSGSAVFTVQAQPEVLSTVPADPMTANVNVGNDIVLTCTARGAPETTFAWFRREPDVQLMTGSRVLITAGVQSGTAPDFVTVESTLMIFSSEESDAGIYSCVASNMVFSDARSDSEDFTLMINSAPAIVDAPENLTVVRPDDATFSCQASGRPRPAITWWRLTSADSGFVQIMMGDPGYSIEEAAIGDYDLRSSLTILGTLPGDTGEYLCQAQNIISSAAESAFLTVQDMTTALFQLRLIPVGDCATFVVDSPDQKFQEIISAVVDTVSMMCSCPFTQDNIQNSEFSCRGIENTVVFRAEITYTSFTFTAAQLVDFVSQWVQSAPSFVVGPSMSRINVDTNCPTQLDSFLSEDCVSMDQGETQSIGAVIGGVVAGVCVVLIFTGIVIAVLFIQKRKKKSFSPSAEEIELSRDTVPVDTNPAYGSSVKKPAIFITSNPAYGHFSSLTEQSAAPYEIPLHRDERKRESQSAAPYEIPLRRDKQERVPQTAASYEVPLQQEREHTYDYIPCDLPPPTHI